MQGKININNAEHYFSFDRVSFKLTVHEYTEIRITDKIKSERKIKPGEVLRAYSTENMYTYVKFIVNDVETNYMDRIIINVYYYIETSKDIEKFDAMSFLGDELNSFYDINNSIDIKMSKDDGQHNGQLDITVKKFKDVNKEYRFDNEDTIETLSFNYFRQLTTKNSSILNINTDMNLEFKEPQNSFQMIEHYLLVYNFFRFVTYRNNIRFNSIKLKIRIEHNSYEDVGQLKLYDNEDNFYVESDKIKKSRLIKLDYLGEKAPLLFDLLRDGRLYMRHYPENSADMKSITPARFILVTAAFEWEFQEIYGDYKYNQNRNFRIATDLIYEIIEVEKENKAHTKKTRKYLGDYQRVFKHSVVSLAEKIQYALIDNSEVLEIFIKILYNMNRVNAKDYTYNNIAERIAKQRNNYAHGQIDREIDFLVIIDFIVLEWLLYAQRLKQLGFDVYNSKKIINSLFGRNIAINR